MNSRSPHRTARKISFVIFWTCVAGGACYLAYEILVGYGLEWRTAAIAAGFVFICAVIFANRYEPR